VERFLLTFFLLTSLHTISNADSRENGNPYGVLTFFDWNHGWNNFQYDSIDKVKKGVALLKEAHVGFVRQAIPWNLLETTEGTMDFERYDQVVALIRKKKMGILGTLCYSPEWTGREWNDAPDQEKFLHYVEFVVKRYKSQIKYWELWNEPDQSAYWKTQDRMVTYTELLKKVYPLIKQIDPTAVVVLGSVHNPYPLKQMYRNGAKDYFDIVNIHPFANPLTSEPLQRVKGIYDAVRATMDQNKDSQKQVWITEIGCPGVADPDKEMGWWEGPPPSEKQQAEWVSKLYDEIISWPGVGKVFWAFFQDTHSFGDAVDYFGLVRRDFSKKPAYDAYRKCASGY